MLLSEAHYILDFGGLQIQFYHTAMEESKKIQKGSRFNLLILCAFQQGPVKVCSCYLVIISAALTMASLPHWRSFPFKQGKQDAWILLKKKWDD